MMVLLVVIRITRLQYVCVQHRFFSRPFGLSMKDTPWVSKKIVLSTSAWRNWNRFNDLWLKKVSPTSKNGSTPMIKCMIPKMSQKMVWHPTILWLKGPSETPFLGRMLVEHLRSSQFCERFLGPTLGPGMSSESIHVIIELEEKHMHFKTKMISKRNRFLKKKAKWCRKDSGCKQM